MKHQSVIRPSIVALGVVFCLSLASCSKNANNTYGTLYFTLYTTIDSNMVTDTTALYKDSLGRHFGLSVAQFFIYDVVLQNTSGVSYTVPNAYILKDIDSNNYVVGSVPPGSYRQVSFKVGLDAGTDGLSPAIFAPPGSYISTSSMWYSSGTNGYMWMQIKGFADTTAAQSGTNLASLSYIISSTSNVETVTLPVRGTGSYSSYAPYSMPAGGTQYIAINCDYGKLLRNVNFKTQDSTDTYYFNPVLSDSIAANIPNMFRYAN